MSPAHHADPRSTAAVRPLARCATPYGRARRRRDPQRRVPGPGIVTRTLQDGPVPPVDRPVRAYPRPAAVLARPRGKGPREFVIIWA